MLHVYMISLGILCVYRLCYEFIIWRDGEELQVPWEGDTSPALLLAPSDLQKGSFSFPFLSFSSSFRLLLLKS